jgi:hypothetical protein
MFRISSGRPQQWSGILITEKKTAQPRYLPRMSAQPPPALTFVFTFMALSSFLEFISLNYPGSYQFGFTIVFAFMAILSYTCSRSVAEVSGIYGSSCDIALHLHRLILLSFKLGAYDDLLPAYLAAATGPQLSSSVSQLHGFHFWNPAFSLVFTFMALSSFREF